MLLMTQNRELPRVVIVGAGFAGINAAKALGGLPVRVTVLDRKNHHTFQPLLYQVALAALSPAEIASPIRNVLRDDANTEVLLGEVIRDESCWLLKRPSGKVTLAGPRRHSTLL